MKKIAFIIITAACMAATAVHAQSSKEKAVTNAVEKLRTAMVNGDSAALEKLVTADLSYGHSGGHIDDKKEFISKLASGKSDFVSITLTDQTITISGNTAIVRHKLDAVTNDNNKPGDVHLLVMLVWRKLAGHWKLLARQAVKNT